MIFGTRKAERDEMLVAIRGRPGLRDLPLIEQAEEFKDSGLDGTWSEAFSSGDTLCCASSDGALLFTAGGTDAFRVWDATSSGTNLAVIETRVGKQYKTSMTLEASGPDAAYDTVWLGESDGRVSEVTVPTAAGRKQADGTTLPREPRLQRQFTAHSRGVSAMMMDNQRMRLWTGARNGELAVWHVAQLRGAAPCRKTKLGCPYFEPGKFTAVSSGLERDGAATTDPVEFILSVAPGSLDQVWCGHGKAGLHVYDSGSHGYLASAIAPADGAKWSAATALTCGTVIEATVAAARGGGGGRPRPMSPPPKGGGGASAAAASSESADCAECGGSLFQRMVSEELVMRNKCDRCGKADLPVGTTLFGCRSCAFDLCEACFHAVGPGAASSLHSPSAGGAAAAAVAMPPVSPGKRGKARKEEILARRAAQRAAASAAQADEHELHLSVWTGDASGTLTQWEPSAAFGTSAAPPTILRSIRARPGVAVTSIIHCVNQIGAQGGSVLYAGFADGALLAYDYSKYTSSKASAFSAGPIRSISQGAHSAISAMCLFQASIPAVAGNGIGFPRFGRRGGSLLKLATLASNGEKTPLFEPFLY